MEIFQNIKLLNIIFNIFNNFKNILKTSNIKIYKQYYFLVSFEMSFPLKLCGASIEQKNRMERANFTSLHDISNGSTLQGSFYYVYVYFRL